ncbi:MAG TPA: hypothetical protein VHL11_12725, partial [Phototrophicaceae bacterium]|nr:hypothetical protein [Phototrophicaceae bacterium]
MNLFRLLPVLVLFDCALPVTQTIWQVAKVEQYEAAIADITGIPAESVNVVLSPDGQTLAWMKDEHTLCLYPFANEQTRCVSPPNQAVLPLELTWSRDQHYLSLYGYSTSGYALWLYSLKEAVFTPVIENDTSWSGYAPVWAADDAARDETLYYLDLEFKPDDQTWSGAIFSVTPPNLEPQQIFELPPALAASNYLRLAVVSPDGQRLILLSQLHQGMLETDDEISGLWLIDLADRSLSQLASMAELRAGFPRWYQGYFELESVTWNATANGLL